jgi:hypothetical protein
LKTGYNNKEESDNNSGSSHGRANFTHAETFRDKAVCLPGMHEEEEMKKKKRRIAP